MATVAKKRKICFIITSQVHYGRSKLVLAELKKRKDVDLQIVVGGSAFLPNYGDVLTLMEEDGFDCNVKLTMVLEGGNSIAMAKTTGLGITEFATAFDNLSPDIVVVRGDRYEVLSAAVAAAYLNIMVAHIEGGDLTGTIDESVRHAVTKLSHVHFATNDVSRDRILRMGEHPDYVFNVGSPELEFVIKNNRRKISGGQLNKMGTGDIIDVSKPYLMVMQHPVTTEIGQNREHAKEILEAVRSLKIQTIWFWPNVDAGTDEISKELRVFKELGHPYRVRFSKYLPPEEFVTLLRGSECLVGNSSSGIKECSFLGTPVVNVGTRQNGRTRAENVVDVDYDKKQIKEAIRRQLKHGRYSSSRFYYKPATSRKIAEILASIKPYRQKVFYEKDNV